MTALPYIAAVILALTFDLDGPALALVLLIAACHGVRQWLARMDRRDVAPAAEPARREHRAAEAQWRDDMWGRP